MPNDLAIIIGLDETVGLNKGYYPANAFAVPGCEVEIDGEWIPCDERNKDRILAENPATLNYRINGRLLRKYGYKSGDTVEGSVESIAQVGTTGRWESTGFSQPVRITVR